MWVGAAYLISFLSGGQYDEPAGCPNLDSHLFALRLNCNGVGDNSFLIKVDITLCLTHYQPKFLSGVQEDKNGSKRK
jgi:hypothetical protein